MISSTILQVDSRDRTSGNPSDFIINLGDSSIPSASRVCPIGCSFTHVFPNIDESRKNNTLDIKLIDYNKPKYIRFFLEVASWDSHPGTLIENAIPSNLVSYNVVFDIDYASLRQDSSRPSIADDRASSNKNSTTGRIRRDVDAFCFKLQQQFQQEMVSKGCPNSDYITFVPMKDSMKFRIVRSASMIFRVRKIQEIHDAYNGNYPADYKEIDGYEASDWLIPCKFPMNVMNDGFSQGQSLPNSVIGAPDVIGPGWLGVWANNIRKDKANFAVEWSQVKNNKLSKAEMTVGFIELELSESLCFLGTQISVSIVSGSYNINNIVDGLNAQINSVLSSWLSANIDERFTKPDENGRFITFSLDPIRFIIKISMYQHYNFPFPLCFYIPEDQELAKQLGLYSSATEYALQKDALKYSGDLMTPMWRVSQDAKALVDIFPISGLLIFATGLVSANTVNSKGEYLPLLARITNLGAFGERTVWENWSAFELFLQPSASSISSIRFWLTDLDYKPVKMTTDWNLTVAIFSIDK